MANFRAYCKHCETVVSFAPQGRIILFAGEGVSDTFFNYRCPECEGVNHHNNANTKDYLNVLTWFSLDGNRPTIVPASHGDSEIAEVFELANIGFPRIGIDDLLDLMLDLRRHESEALDLRDMEDSNNGESVAA